MEAEIIGGGLFVALAGIGQLFLVAWGVLLLCLAWLYFVNRNKTCECIEPEWEGEDER